MIKGAFNRSAVGTVGVDDLDRLPFVQTNRAAAPCRYNLKICRLIAIPLPLAHLPRRDHRCWTTRKGSCRIRAVARVQTIFGDHLWHSLLPPITIGRGRRRWRWVRATRGVSS